MAAMTLLVGSPIWRALSSLSMNLPSAKPLNTPMRRMASTKPSGLSGTRVVTSCGSEVPMSSALKNWPGVA